MFAFAVLTLVTALVCGSRWYFTEPWDAVSALTVPILPGFDYAALLVVMAVALRRRLRAAWWLLVICGWLVLPELESIPLDPVGGGSWLLASGFVPMAVVLLIDPRLAFAARLGALARHLYCRTTCFLLGGAVILVLSTSLVMRLRHRPEPGVGRHPCVGAMLGRGRAGLGSADYGHPPRCGCAACSA